MTVPRRVGLYSGHANSSQNQPIARPGLLHVCERGHSWCLEATDDVVGGLFTTRDTALVFARRYCSFRADFRLVDDLEWQRARQK